MLPNEHPAPKCATWCQDCAARVPPVFREIPGLQSDRATQCHHFSYSKEIEGRPVEEVDSGKV